MGDQQVISAKSSSSPLIIKSKYWFYLDANRQSQGPFPLSYLQELQKTSSYFNDNTLFYSQELGSWTKLGQLPLLKTTLHQNPTPSIAPSSISKTSAHQPTIIHPATKKPQQEDLLDEFLDEINQIEQQNPDVNDRPESPPSDERQFTDDDGTVYEWNSKERKFLPLEPLYSENDMVYDPDTEGSTPAIQLPSREKKDQEDRGIDQASKSSADTATHTAINDNVPSTTTSGAMKRTAQQEAALEAAQERADKAKAARDAQQGWIHHKTNTSVYITGLPSDVTEEEVAEVFGKFGIIKLDAETQKPRIKIYKDPVSGMPKGDGLVTYLKEPSVELAIRLLHESPFRYGMPNMMVGPAKFEQKGSEFVKRDHTSKAKRKKVLETQEKKALGWKGFDDSVPAEHVTVVLKHMFTLQEMDNEVNLSEELEEDVRREASKLGGDVVKIRVFKGHPEGVVTVRFKTIESADACVATMHGRWFGGKQIEASKWDGVTKYNEYAKRRKESEEEQQARLEKFMADVEVG